MKSIPGEASEGKEGTKAGSLSYLGGKLSWVASCISLKHGAWKRWPWILEAELGDDELRYYIFCCGRFLAKCEGMSWFLLAAHDQLWKEGEGRIVTQKGTQDLLTFEKLSEDTAIGFAAGKMCSEEKAKEVSSLLLLSWKYPKVRVGSHVEGPLKRSSV